MINLVFQLIDLCVMFLFVRVWLQLVRADFYNPFSQTIVKLTNPVTQPIRSLLPSKSKIDAASALLALVLVVIKCFLAKGQFPVPAIVALSAFEYIHLVGETIFWVMIIKVILSWVSQGRNPIDAVIFQLTSPLIAPIQRVVPPVGMIDFSVMIFLFVLYFLDYLHAILANKVISQIIAMSIS
ncbi:YggT family protein [Thorsellia kenyensis]|uniref:YggT family protein n=1 Tax=Thorsellia kenyensis TaxID=1549888 RepID=A0ABV6CCZ0_9GAMM